MSAASTSPRRSARAQRLGDAAGPQPVVAGVEVEDPAARPELVERVVVQRGAGRVVVGVDEPAGRRVHQLRHLGRRQDLVRQRLRPVAGGRRQPLVATLPVADQVRREAVDPAGLQVLAQRQLAAGEVRDVPGAVGVRPVLRADVEAGQPAAEVGEVARLQPLQEGVQLLGGGVAGVLHRQRGAGGGVELDDRAVVAPRHDQRRRRDAVAGRHHGDRVRLPVADPVRPEDLGHREHRLRLSPVDGGEPAGRGRVRHGPPPGRCRSRPSGWWSSPRRSTGWRPGRSRARRRSPRRRRPGPARAGGPGRRSTGCPARGAGRWRGSAGRPSCAGRPPPTRSTRSRARAAAAPAGAPAPRRRRRGSDPRAGRRRPAGPGRHRSARRWPARRAGACRSRPGSSRRG